MAIVVAPPAGAWIETVASTLSLVNHSRSHPLRVRGLKPWLLSTYYPLLSSHPLRVRGLKHVITPYPFRLFFVAPPAGAWIETYHTIIRVQQSSGSHPLRVRGLKHADADITDQMVKSHPLRVRGLKLHIAFIPLLRIKSHPLRVRGLKREYSYLDSAPDCVAPPAGAWIETKLEEGVLGKEPGRTPCGCVD